MSEGSRIEKTPLEEETAEKSRKRSSHSFSDRNAVARLSCAKIESMSCSELIQAIRECRASKLRPEADQRLESFGRRKLQKLIYILRRIFREQEPKALSYPVGDENIQAAYRGSANQGAVCQ